MTLEVLICTYGDGIAQAAGMVLPPEQDVRWLVSWQRDGYDAPVPHELLRDDVSVVMPEGRGLSRNRNNALLHATGDVCVVADDDNRYDMAALLAVRRLFENNPRIDVALCALCGHDGQPIKPYPATPFDYGNRPRGYYVQSQEIVFRRTSVLGKIRFDERFGIGAPLPGGEDEVFVHNAWQKGLRVEFHPIVICATDRWSTGTRIDSSPQLLRAKGAVMAVIYGRLGATLRVAKHALAHHVSLMAMLKGVWMHL